MTKDEAVQTVTKAILRQQGLPDHTTVGYGQHMDFAANLVASLEALGLFTPSK